MPGGEDLGATSLCARARCPKRRALPKCPVPNSSGLWATPTSWQGLRGWKLVSVPVALQAALLLGSLLAGPGGFVRIWPAAPGAGMERGEEWRLFFIQLQLTR